MKRKVAIIGMLLVALLAGATAWVAIAPDPLERLADGIQPGTPEADVEAVLGKPTVDDIRQPNGTIMNKWVTDRVIVMIYLDSDARVDSKLVVRRPLYDRFRACLPW